MVVPRSCVQGSEIWFVGDIGPPDIPAWEPETVIGVMHARDGGVVFLGAIDHLAHSLVVKALDLMHHTPIYDCSGRRDIIEEAVAGGNVGVGVKMFAGEPLCVFVHGVEIIVNDICDLVY